LKNGLTRSLDGFLPMDPKNILDKKLNSLALDEKEIMKEHKNF
jgi:hypothetical protein